MQNSNIPASSSIAKKTNHRHDDGPTIGMSLFALTMIVDSGLRIHQWSEELAALQSSQPNRPLTRFEKDNVERVKGSIECSVGHLQRELKSLQDMEREVTGECKITKQYKPDSSPQRLIGVVTKFKNHNIEIVTRLETAAQVRILTKSEQSELSRCKKMVVQFDATLADLFLKAA